MRGPRETVSVFSLPFTAGLDIATSERLGQPPYLREATNVYFDEQGALRKRPGYRKLTRGVAGGRTISSARGLVGYDTQLLLADHAEMYAFAGSQWRSLGAYPALTTTTRRLWPGQFTQGDFSYARNDAFEAYAYADARGGTYFSVADLGSRQFVVADQQLRTNEIAPKFAQGPDGVLFFAVDPATNKLYVTPFTWASTSPLGVRRFVGDIAPPGTGWTASNVYNVHGDDAGVSVAYIAANGSDLVVARVAQRTGVLLESMTYTIGSFTGALAQQIAIANNPQNPFEVAVTLAGGYMAAIVLDLRSTSYRSINASGAPLGFVLAAAPTYDDDGLHITITAADPSGGRIAAVYNESDLAVSVPHMIAAGRTFTFNDRKYFPVASAEYVDSPTYYLYDIKAGQPVAKWANGLAALDPRAQIAKPLAQDGAVEIPLPRTVSLISENGTVKAQAVYSMSRIEVDTRPLQAVRLGPTLFFPGSLPLFFDGTSLAEYGFLSAPTLRTVAFSAGAALQAGKTYAYQAVWESVDAAGQLHRSAASTPKVVVAPGYTAKVTLTFDYLTTRRATSVLAVYRTLADSPDVYYRVSSFSAPALNDPTSAAPLTVVDNISDTALASREILYTVGGELDNDPPPSCTVAFASRDRIFVAGTDDAPESVFYSKTAATGVAPGFSLAFELRMANPPGSVTALAATEGRQVAFKSDCIFVWAGDGPTSAGTNDSFTRPSLVTRTLGCDGQASVFPDERDGVYFASQGQIWLLNRALDLVRVGAPVRPLTQSGIKSVVAIAGAPRIRFGMPDGQAVYHQTVAAPYPLAGSIGAWTRYSGLPQVDATVWDGAYAWVTPDGFVCVETADFDDDGRSYNARITTSWVRAGEMAGTATFGDIAIVGQKLAEHSLLVAVSIDYRPLPVARMALDTADALQTSTWGDGDWAQDAWGGYADGVYLFRGILPVETPQGNVVRFTITDGPSSAGTLRDSFSLDALTVVAKPEEGLAHVRRAKTMG